MEHRSLLRRLLFPLALALSGTPLHANAAGQLVIGVAFAMKPVRLTVKPAAASR